MTKFSRANAGNFLASTDPLYRLATWISFSTGNGGGNEFGLTEIVGHRDSGRSKCIWQLFASCCRTDTEIRGGRSNGCKFGFWFQSGVPGGLQDRSDDRGPARGDWQHRSQIGQGWRGLPARSCRCGLMNGNELSASYAGLPRILLE